jgi:hypothetical protein
MKKRPSRNPTERAWYEEMTPRDRATSNAIRNEQQVGLRVQLMSMLNVPGVSAILCEPGVRATRSAHGKIKSPTKSI